MCWSRDPVTTCLSVTQAIPNTQSMCPCAGIDLLETPHQQHSNPQQPFPNPCTIAATANSNAAPSLLHCKPIPPPKLRSARWCQIKVACKCSPSTCCTNSRCISSPQRLWVLLTRYHRQTCWPTIDSRGISSSCRFLGAPRRMYIIIVHDQQGRAPQAFGQGLAAERPGRRRPRRRPARPGSGSRRGWRRRSPAAADPG